MIGIGEYRELLEIRCGMIMANDCYKDGYNQLVPYDSRYEAFANRLKEEARTKGLPNVPMLRGMAHNARKEGNLELANNLTQVLFLRKYPFDRETLQDWLEVMLLAKNWDDAHWLLFCLYQFNAAVNRLSVASGYSIWDYRSWGCPTPDTEVTASVGVGYLRDVMNRPFSTKAEVEASIRACGWSDYWNAHFSLSQGEYYAFANLFGSSY